MITGKGAYSRLKFESGVHRVQRVPDTEASGRIHTSTATVVVLPEVEDVEIDINPADIKMEVFRASGAGGQHINKTSSAVRLIHIPTGMVAECQTERSQFQNRDYAMRLLRSRLYEQEKAKQDSEVANARKSQVGSGDRSEKIRTYNYPQGRITDHRIGLSIYQMEKIDESKWDEYLDWSADFEYNKIGIPKPDLVIFLDMPVEVSQKLMTARYDGDESKKDVHEANVDFLNKCRKSALYTASKQGWAVIPCSDGEKPLPIEEIHNTILDFVKKELKEK